MPFKSKAQQAFMYIHHPAIAKRWSAKYGTPKNLPKHIKPKGRKKKKSKS